MYPFFWSFESMLLFSLITWMMIHQTTSIPHALGVFCFNTTSFSNNSAYQTNLNTLFRSLSSNATNNLSGFYTTLAIDNSSTTAREDIYGQFMCRGDLNSSSCHDCVEMATTRGLPLENCPNRKVAVIYYDECTVRYSNVSFAGTLTQNPAMILWQQGDFTEEAPMLHDKVNSTMHVIAKRAAMGDSLKKFATSIANYSVFNVIYGLAQCTPDLSSTDCYTCLTQGIPIMHNNSRGGGFFAPSCVIQYYNTPFFNNSRATIILPEIASISPTPSSSPSPTRSGDLRKRWPAASLIAVFPISAVILILLLVALLINIRKKKVMNNGSDESKRFVDALQYELSTLRSATRNFATENKLGEGGFGQVYKGVLENGEEIAVKRLSETSGQGIKEFETEIVLVAKLQHKNLVKLLGYCTTQKESLLIYEFLPNSSLDQLLLDPVRKIYLEWQTRVKIIVGIARGLQYLHEDSRIKVVHRDLKSSNILLDEAINPKIADFGLARLFEADQTRGDTSKIAGTRGYMAPEYLNSGEYSTKSDVYSFGVIVLEIISGQMNKFFGRPENEEPLLHRAWRLWGENTAFDLVDTTLGGNFAEEEVLKCIQIGLLCIQENPIDRPRMSAIVAALNGQTISLPTPKQPQFFRGTSTSEARNAYSSAETITEIHSRY